MTTMTDKTRLVLAELVSKPNVGWSARDVARGAGVAPNVAGALLGRLISMGFVQDARDAAGVRFYRIVPGRLDDAIAAVADEQASNGVPPARFQPAGAPETAPPRQAAHKAARKAATRPAPTLPAPESASDPASGYEPDRMPGYEVDGLNGTVTVSQVRAAHAAGKVSREFLAQVERAVQATVKRLPARAGR